MVVRLFFCAQGATSGLLGAGGGSGDGLAHGLDHGGHHRIAGDAILAGSTLHQGAANTKKTPRPLDSLRSASQSPGIFRISESF
jgi:hypothetical protein